MFIMIAGHGKTITASSAAVAFVFPKLEIFGNGEGGVGGGSGLPGNENRLLLTLPEM